MLLRLLIFVVILNILIKSLGDSLPCHSSYESIIGSGVGWLAGWLGLKGSITSVAYSLFYL